MDNDKILLLLALVGVLMFTGGVLLGLRASEVSDPLPCPDCVGIHFGDIKEFEDLEDWRFECAWRDRSEDGLLKGR